MPRPLRTPVPVALALVLVAPLLAPGVPRAAAAEEVGRYLFEPGGKVQGIRTADVDRDGRTDLVLLLSRPAEGGARRPEIVVLRTPESPVPRSFYPPEAVSRIPVDQGALAAAGAVAVGRFAADGGVRLRFLAGDGIHDLLPDGTEEPPSDRARVPTLFSRSPGRTLVFWDGVGDLDGDGRDEIWFPLGDGTAAMHVRGGTPPGDRTLDLSAPSRGVADARDAIRRHAYVPNLAPADLDGDGTRELLAVKEGEIVAWSVGGAEGGAAAGGPVAPSFRVRLPFVKTDLGPDEVHTPRIQVADANADGVADLLVTLVTGDRRQLGSFRTRFLYFPGPVCDPATGDLVPPKVRIDTESVALHPRFVDLDGDGCLDYVSDSIRGTKVDLIRQVMGQEPEVWLVGFRHDRARGTYEETPSFAFTRPYAREEAVSNRFGRSAFFEGDFDGDGRRDLLDLGNLAGIEVLRGATAEGAGPGDPLRFEAAIVPRMRVPKPLVGDAVVADLDGDRRSDAVLWSEDTLFLLVSGGAR